MTTIKVTTTSPHWPVERQIPSTGGISEDVIFQVNNQIDRCDHWFIIEGLDRPTCINVPPENVWFIAWEPSAIRTYNQKFLAQFNKVISPQNILNHPCVIHKQPALQWMTGARYSDGYWHSFKNFEFFRVCSPATKKDKISVIVSNKRFSEGHRRRLAFVEKLKAAMPDQLDIFGTGINHVEDKWDATFDYKYSLVLENSRELHYWSEKLSDAFLAWTLPIYYGAPNILEYFSCDSLLPIDIEAETCIQRIQDALQNDHYAQHFEAIKKARNQILHEHNLFPYMLAMIKEHSASNPQSYKGLNYEILIRPEATFRPFLTQLKASSKAVASTIRQRIQGSLKGS